MAKKIDPFDKFKEATLGRSSELIDAISPKKTEDTPAPQPKETSPAPVETRYVETVVQAATQPVVKVSKNADRELVSFHIAKDIKKKLGLLKYETDRSFGELYTEAIEDLLRKYDKI